MWHGRMLDKKNVPSEDDIKNHIGEKSVGYIEIIKKVAQPYKTWQQIEWSND